MRHSSSRLSATALAALLSFLLVATLPACGGGGDTTEADGAVSDGAPGGSDGAVVDGAPGVDAEEGCSAAASYAPGVASGVARIVSEAGSDFLGFWSELDQAERPDELRIHMYEALGTAGYHTGSYDLSAQDKVVVTIATDVGLLGDLKEFYDATSGTVVVTSVDGTFAGTLEDVVFTPRSEPGCGSQIASAEFSGTIQ